MPSHKIGLRRATSKGGFPSIKRVVSRSRDEDNNNNIKRRPSPSPPPPPPPPRQVQQRQVQQHRPVQQQRTSSRSGSLQQQAQQQKRQQSNQQRPASKANARSLNDSREESVFSGLSQEATLNNSASVARNNKKMGGDPAPAPMQKIRKVYGPSANVYTDVLKVPPTATPGEIREAFFCLRYDIYQKLDAGASHGATGSEALTSDERKEVEAQMDAITGAFHILSDAGRRKAYDASLVQAKASSNLNTSVDTAETDEMGFPLASGTRRSNSDGTNVTKQTENSTPSKLSPSKADSNHLPIGQRRSVFRRNRARSAAGSGGGGINPGRRVIAEDVSGGLNTRRPNPSGSADSVFDSEEESPQWMDFNSGSGSKGSFGKGVAEGNGQNQQPNRNAAANNPSSTTKGTGRLGSSGDKYVATSNDTNEPPVASPTGVDAFDSSNNPWSRRVKHGSDLSKETVLMSGQKSDSNVAEDDSKQKRSDTKTALVPPKDDEASESAYDDDTRTYGDETRTYDDDTRTYGDDTRTYDDDTATYGETVDDTTIGESTWASEYDDDDTNTSFGTREGGTGEGGKYSPGHKKGTKPHPILKSALSSKKGVKRSDSGNGRRVTIHSHRRTPGEDGDDFNLFEGASCPIPSLGSIREEVTGTYNDFTSALHQVGNAFVISPDDIDRLADKIRDAKIELGENYHRQVKERQETRALSAK